MQVDLCDFEAHLVYKVSSTLGRDVNTENPCLENDNLYHRNNKIMIVIPNRSYYDYIHRDSLAKQNWVGRCIKGDRLSYTTMSR